MTWQNWAGTASADPAHRYWPRSVADISAAVTEAGAAGLTVRALGSGHSFTPAAVTTGAALDLSGWTGIVSSDIPSGVVTARSGTTIRELNAALDALGLAMPNLGDIDAQTIAGAISTGTHGTGARIGGLATFVEALELVLADGSVVTCSATARPDLFAAARVSLGAFGIISTVTLRCVPAFTLAADERPMPLPGVLDRFDEFADDNDHFEFYWFPYGQNALVKRNNTVFPGGTIPGLTPGGTIPPSPPLRTEGQPPVPPGEGHKAPPASAGAGSVTPGFPSASSSSVQAPPAMPAWRRFWEYEVMENAAFGGLCRTGRAVPALIKPLNRLAAATLSKRSYSAASHQVFVTPRRVRFVESEYAVPRESLLDVLSELRAGVPRLKTPVMFPVEVRVAAADDIWLSTAYGRDTAYVAIHQYVGLAYEEYFRLFQSIATSVGGRPHWGKMHTLGAERLRELYPRFGDFARVRDETDPEGRFTNSYLQQVFGR
jgi:FAD/FMN-containing dehydrogenase